MITLQTYLTSVRLQHNIKGQYLRKIFEHLNLAWHNKNSEEHGVSPITALSQNRSKRENSKKVYATNADKSKSYIKNTMLVSFNIKFVR